MTDDTGIIQHATFSVPARNTGYCVDDNARALIVALEADRLHRSAETKKLVTTYLSYLHCSQTADGQFQNLMSYSRVFAGDRSEDCLGRAVWALGAHGRCWRPTTAAACWRGRCSSGPCPRWTELGPRGSALAILGLASFLAAEPDAAAAPGGAWPVWRRVWSSATRRRPPPTGAGSNQR